MDPVGALQQLGFSEYEARAYIALLERYPVNGAAVAKLSRIPRANVYAVLQKLEDRRAVVRVEMEGGTAYAPIPPEELFQHLSSQFEGSLHAARTILEPLANKIEDTYVQNLEGQQQLLHYAQTLIGKTAHNLIMGVWLPESQALSDVVTEAQARGVVLTTLCFHACPEPCPFCRPPVFRYGISPENDSRWLVVIRDDAEMLVGSIDQKQTVAIRTKQPRLIEMASWYIRHSIAVATLLSELGPDFLEKLSPTTQSLLQSLGPGKGWLETMLSLLSK